MEKQNLLIDIPESEWPVEKDVVSYEDWVRNFIGENEEKDTSPEKSQL